MQQRKWGTQQWNVSWLAPQRLNCLEQVRKQIHKLWHRVNSHHRLDSKTWRRTILGPRNDRGQRNIAANATRTSDRTHIGNAPCISFRTLLYPSGTKTQTDKVEDQERQYTRACIEAHTRHLIMGRYFLHEHPVHALAYATDARIYEWWKGTLGAGSDVSLAFVVDWWWRRAAQGWQLCWQEKCWRKLSSTVNWPEWDDGSIDVFDKIREWSVESTREAADRRTASVCTQLDQQQPFLSWIHENGKKTITISREICLIQSKSRKKKEKKSSGCWRKRSSWTTFLKVNVRNHTVDIIRWNGFWKTVEKRSELDWSWERSRRPKVWVRETWAERCVLCNVTSGKPEGIGESRDHGASG